MRAVCLGMTLVQTLILASAPAALAQATTEGPLAAPIQTTKPAAKPSAKPHHKATKTSRRQLPADGGFDRSASPTPPPATPAPGTPLPADPVDFGMKWNGSNDTARDTRVQNYNGGAEGTGAEVGMKLHF